MLKYCMKITSENAATYPKPPCGLNRPPNTVGSCRVCQEYDSIMTSCNDMHDAQRKANHAIDRYMFKLIDMQTEIKMLNRMKTLPCIIQPEDPNNDKTCFEVSKIWKEEYNGFQICVKEHGCQTDVECEISVEPPKLVVERAVGPRECWPFARADFF